MKEYQRLKGIVTKTRLIKADLVVVQLNVNDKTIQSLVVHHVLEFLADVMEGDTIEVYGYYNQRHQFIITKYLTTTKFHSLKPDHPSHLKYPSQRKEI